MARIFNSYSKSYILDESKLLRIKSLIDEKFSGLSLTPKYKFNIFTKGKKEYTFDNVDDVLNIDNSKKERIENFFITCNDEKGTVKTEKDNILEMHFHGNTPARMCLDIIHDDSKWGNELTSILDEQIERTIQDSLMYRLSRQKWILLIAVLAFVLVVKLGFELFSSSTIQFVPLESKEIDELEILLNDTTMTGTEKASEIVIMYAKKLVEKGNEKQATFFQSLFDSWTSIFFVLPILIILISFIYMIFYCYPNAVYLWGDAKEWHKKLVNRRKTVWSVIIFSMIIGVLSNLFVVAVTTFINS